MKIICAWHTVCAALLVALGLGLLGGCVSTNRDSQAKVTVSETGKESPRSGRKNFPRLTVNGGDYDTLGQLVRGIGEAGGGGGIVLVAGLEERPVPSIDLVRSAYTVGLKKLVGPADCLVESGAFYQFVYPPGYEPLLELSLGEQVHPRFRKLRGTFAIGAGTDMYNALALLSETLGATIIADNTIADVWCGELFLQDAPAATIVEALLRSARVVPDAFVVESTETYIFLRSVSNRSREDTCVNRGSLTPEVQAMLEKTVNFRLPTQDGVMQFQREAVPLRAVLAELSQQLGVPVSVEPVLADFPVNQAIFVGLPVSDVLNLIIRQWPVARFGYRADEKGIVFCINETG